MAQSRDLVAPGPCAFDGMQKARSPRSAAVRRVRRRQLTRYTETRAR